MDASRVTYDVGAVRNELPALNDVAYMNCGTEGIMAEPVLRVYLEKLTRFERYGHWTRVEFADAMAECRQRFATLLNCGQDEVAVTRNGTDGVSIVLGCYPFAEGDELLIGSEEHPAIVYPAIALQTHRGVTVRRFRFEHDPAATLENFRSALSPKTRLTAFSHVSCETGIRNPAAEMIQAAHERGIEVLLDGAQSVGSFPVDFRSLEADYLTGSAHKWLCGPKGTGVLVVRKDRLDQLIPAYVGGGSFADNFAWPEMATPERVRATFAPAASRFEYGMRNPALYAGLTAAIDYLAAIGWDAIAAHEQEMATRLKERLAAMPRVKVQTPMAWEHSSAIVNFALEGVSGAELSKRLWNDFQVVQRAVREPNGVRISNAYFTSDADHDRLLTAVTAIARDTVPAAV